ncbi:MAG: hypothetical protein CVU90_13875 [Firmicutes bacterium HGW-Firmicutes-15]|nr:MAG: hypothetical protein CVU90_13875 [Firmicutes bacterium HGW-Firmicutes-15]
MAKVDRIVIKGFKSIKDTNIELGNLNVLIGANGAGKTNFISFFKMLNELYNKNLQLYTAKSGGANSLLYFGKKHTKYFFANVYFGKNDYWFQLEPTDDDQFIFASEGVGFHNPAYPNPYEDHYGGGHKETALFKISKSKNKMTPADHVISSLRGWKVYHFHDTSQSAEMKNNCDINDNDVLKPNAANLAPFLYMLKTKHYGHYEQILNTVQLVAPFIKDFFIQPLKLSEGLIRLKWVHKDDDEIFDITQLSDGTIRTICLITLLLQPDPPSTIIIDEPELGLHPYAINILGSVIKSVSKKLQIIISTQSISLVDVFEPEDIIVVDYYDMQSHFRKYSSDELKDWLDEYSLGELWAKNVLGGRPKW